MTGKSDVQPCLFLLIWNILLAETQYGLAFSVSISFLDGKLHTEQAQKQSFVDERVDVCLFSLQHNILLFRIFFIPSSSLNAPKTVE